MTRFISRLLVFLALLPALGPACAADSGPPTEYQVKAAFLYSFTNFVDWPASAFADPAQPFVIGVLGTDPFGAVLDDVVRGKMVNGRPIVLRRAASASALDHAQVLFIGSSERGRLGQIAAQIEGRAVLTVADMEPAACRGVVVVMSVGLDDRLKLAINVDAAEQAGLTVSSRLLRLAEIIRD